ncbi:hypothetical protein D9619_012625 [Psilocybe cf. subviscida]|uniref:BZIP domain-containing protein n=1 Tax=Psilocybe cf. subviscida TaxID=2480587 RepID=A0A8H5B709_9AGAR|nr:hypothetical protein D9619_012625 [Psilocybe cf. subviscida]
MASSASPAQRALSASSSPAAESASASASIMAHQMEVDPPAVRAPDSNASAAASSCSSSATGRANQAASANASSHTHQPSKKPVRFLEQELIPPTSRLSRLPTAVPSPSTLTSTPPTVAIQSQSNNLPNYLGQDVHDFVNNSASRTQSTVTRPFGQPQHLETSVSSSTQPLTNHVLTHPIRRPRTSTHIFKSTTDLAAHYGIPQLLPPAPRTNSTYNHQPAQQQPSSAIRDFQTLSANYLNMLNNQKPAETTTAAAPPAAPSTMMSAPTMAEPSAPASMIPADLMSTENFDGLFGMSTASPTSAAEVTHADNGGRTIDGFDFNSPLIGDLDYSPGDTPFQDFLSTPGLHDVNETSPYWADEPMLTSPMMEWLDDSRPLFGGPLEEEITVQKAPEAIAAPFDNLYTISPETPALQSFNEFPNASLSVPTQLPGVASSSAVAPVPQRSTSSSARRSKPTGIRKGVTPNSLLDVDAPTQPRKYVTPSATSKKDVPAVFARKRARSTAFGDEDDELAAEDMPLNPTEAELIEIKRRQNTVAARKSRKRKLEQFQRLERDADHERRLKEVWTERANTLLAALRQYPEYKDFPDFPADEPKQPIGDDE